MNCGYCGLRDSKIAEKNPENITESIIDTQITDFIYTSCEHNPAEFFETFEDMFTQLREIKKLIQIQLQSVQDLEAYYEEQKKQLLNAVHHYKSTNEHNIQLKEAVVKNFDSNFKKLDKIEIDAKYKSKIEKSLQNYFDKNELDKWAKKCEKAIEKINKKLETMNQEFKEEDIDNLYKSELDKIQDAYKPDKIKLDLHDMNFMVIEGRQNENLETDLNKLKALKEFYTETHSNNLQYIKYLHNAVSTSLITYKKKFQRTKVLLNDIIDNFRNDIRVIDVFTDFERIFNECVSEICTRSKFKYIYRKVLDILNELVNQENERRLKFLKKFSSKIPYQIFPHLKSLCKQINVKKVYETFEDEYMCENDYEQVYGQRLQDIQKMLLQL